jgi:hypothetical protein
MMRLLLLFLLCSQVSFAETASMYHEADIQTDVFEPTRHPEDENIFIFSPKYHVWAVYNKEGERVGYGKATGGRDFCADINEPCRTVEGMFTVFREEDKDCTSNTFPIDEGGGAPMPHCMFFYEGYAIHGSKNLSDSNVSHGCIRVSEAAAQWINKNYIHEGSYVLVLPYS